jgi:metallopeptidase MepB
MFCQFFSSDPWNAQQGRRYRRMILEPGASQDEMKTLVDYLGREPSMTAFYEELGLE